MAMFSDAPHSIVESSCAAISNPNNDFRGNNFKNCQLDFLTVHVNLQPTTFNLQPIPPEDVGTRNPRNLQPTVFNLSRHEDVGTRKPRNFQPIS
jgi:hypothetical protein